MHRAPTIRPIFTLLLTAGTLMACASTPDTDSTPIVITPLPVQTCTPISALTRVDIPAETKTYYAITQIENEPYAPIERKEKQVRVIKEAQTVFVDSEDRQVTDVCAPKIDPDAPTDTGRNPGS